MKGGKDVRTAGSNRNEHSPLPVQFSSLRFVPTRLGSFQFVSIRHVSVRLVSLSPVASRYWRHGPPARRSVPADILPVILVGAVVVVVVVVNFSMCRLGISELAQCKPTPRRRGKIYGTTGPFPCPLLTLLYHANRKCRSSLANNCIAYFWAERVVQKSVILSDTI